MTVKELITELQYYPDDMEVVFDDNELDLVSVHLVEQVHVMKMKDTYMEQRLYNLHHYKSKADTEEDVVIIRGIYK